jgi:hypothetical protein
MIRSLRAIVWLRWRLLLGGLRGGQRRDRLEQVSRIFAMTIPIAFVALSFGSVVAVCILGFVGGRAIGTGLYEPAVIVFILRLSIGVMLALLVIITVASPVQTTLTKYSRLLILPIPRQSLHLVEVAANLADPWLGFMTPGLILFAVGLAFGGYHAAAVVAFVAGLAMVGVLASLGALVSFMVSWLLSSRRRGEMFTLVFVLALSLLAFIPAAISKDFEARKRSDRSTALAVFSVEDFDKRLPVWSRAVPSELYGRAILSSVEGHGSVAWGCVAALWLEAGLLFAASSAAHRRALGSLEGDHRKRRAAAARFAGVRLPILPITVSALAVTQFRTALRSVRGRLAVLLPGPMIALMTVAFRGMPEQHTWATVMGSQGHLVLAAGIIFSIYALQAFSMNLFGSDRGGLTLSFLIPAWDADLALGKVAGCALVLGLAVSLCVVAALAVAPNGSPYYWIAVLFGGLATFLLLSPVNVWFSALFPVAADLSKTGSGGNPHPLPMFAGTILTLAAAAPAALILFADELWIHRPAVALTFMIIWTLMSGAVAIPLVGLAARAIGHRRENLALVAQGR